MSKIPPCPQGLTEWEFFVIRHQEKGNLLFHLASWVLWIVALTASIITLRWEWAVAFLVSPWVGVAGHYIYRDGLVRSRDFIRPQTLIYLTIIFGMILRRSYATESQRVIEKARVLGHLHLIKEKAA